MVNSVYVSGDKRIFLSLDLDWVIDEVLLDTMNLLEACNIGATIFCTHQSPLIKEISQDNRYETGIHPNFNALLDGNISSDYKTVIANMRSMFPQASSVRCHSLTQSSNILDELHRKGFTHELNLLIPAYSGMILRPFVDWNGMIRVPTFWEDDLHCLMGNWTKPLWSPKNLLAQEDINVFCFHPIHLFLNTADLSVMPRCKQVHQEFDKLCELRNPHQEIGIRVFFKQLVDEARQQGYEFALINQIAVRQKEI